MAASHALPDILGGLNTRLERARRIYGPTQQIPIIVNGLYDKLDQLRSSFRTDQVETVLDGIISRSRWVEHLIDLMAKPMVTKEEEEMIRLYRQQWNRCLYSQAMARRAQKIKRS
jgi:paraquat-inducible protein B